MNVTSGDGTLPSEESQGRPIPARLNLAISVMAMAGAMALLWVASHSLHWGTILAAAIAFSFINNTIFSLLHEAVHGIFHTDQRVNEAAGTLFAAMFPTGFTIQRVSHLGHHRRNRTDQELYDYYLPHQSRWLKTYWLYCLLTGFYWAIIPVAGLLYLLMPWAFSAPWFQKGPARWWGFEPMVKDIGNERRGRVWLEVLFSTSFQVSMWLALDLNWVGWLACYWAFGLNWSALQYVDHAWSIRDVREGAWNLRVSRIAQAIFLNYHCHLAHHRSPGTPWRYLPQLVDPAEAHPSFWKIYFSLWGGARPAPAGPGPSPLTGTIFDTDELAMDRVDDDA